MDFPGVDVVSRASGGALRPASMMQVLRSGYRQAGGSAARWCLDYVVRGRGLAVGRCIGCHHVLCRRRRFA